MLERKDKKNAKRNSSVIYPFVHVIALRVVQVFSKFTIHACNPFYSSTFHGISCGRQWRSFAVLYCTPKRHVFVFVKSLLPMLINTLTVLKEEYRIYLASLQQSDIQTWNPYRNSPRES